jgi:hypothetical protein
MVNTAALTVPATRSKATNGSSLLGILRICWLGDFILTCLFEFFRAIYVKVVSNISFDILQLNISHAARLL